MFMHPCHDFKPRDCDCHFGISAPGLNDTCWMNDAFNLFAMSFEENKEEEETEDDKTYE